MDEPVPNTVIHTAFLDDVEMAELVVMCRGIRLIIQVCGRHLVEDSKSGDSALRAQFLNYLYKRDEEPEMVDELEEWALEPLVPFLIANAPAKMPESFTLLAYYAPQTFFFHLISRDDNLLPEQYEGDSQETRSIEPRVTASGLTKSQLSILQIPRVQASTVTVIPDADPFFEFCPIPSVVALSGCPGQRYFFKAASGREEFDREVDVYIRCRESGKPCVPQLIALVEWPDGQLMGMLTEYVDNKGTLADEALQASVDVRQKWMSQIQATVEKLHSLECLWGDVKPENVLIDTHGDARVIDFGGGYSDSWVDGGLAESREGDLQGLARISQYLEL